MKKSIERATRVLAVTAALAGSTAGAASAEKAQPVSPNQDRATRIAHRFSQELYDKNFPKGVRVFDILNGAVKIRHAIGNTTIFNYPVILVESHPNTKDDTNAKLLDGSWLGIPAHDAEGHVIITPVQLQLGNHLGETASFHLRNRHNPVLEGAGVYASTVTNSPDELFGFDIEGIGSFPSVQITAEGMK
jgi:hypothetical protein